MSDRPLVLASTSPYRRALLDTLQMPYEVLAPAYDEPALEGLDAFDAVAAHAHGKAQSLAALRPQALIIGSDQGVVADGELIGKPGSLAGARAQLARLAGGVHHLVTSVCVFDAASGRCEHATERHTLRFRQLTAEEIAIYVALDQPTDCAGSFKIESLGPTLFEGIDGRDPSGIIGLPLILVSELLARFGESVLRRAQRAARDGQERT